jgi:branched-chain amino acid transport system permease protein
MSTLLPLTVVGIVAGCLYGISASGLVVTYTTTGIFNFAHGAIGMIAAFAYWQLAVAWHVPVVLALVIVVLVVAPLFGALLDRVLMRNLNDASLEVVLAVTLGLLLFLVGAATLLWNPVPARVPPVFLSSGQVSIFGTSVTYYQLFIVGITIAVALGLRLLLFQTKHGVALRAVVDSRQLSRLAGASSERYGRLGWAMGASLAALAGCLLAPEVNLNIQTLTLLIINGYAAAMVGRLRNLPLTFAGGIALGVLQSYAVGYLPIGSAWAQLQAAIPMLVLFGALIAFPQIRIQPKTTSFRAPRVVSLKESFITAALFVVAAWIALRYLPASGLFTAGHGVALAIIMLSLVLLAGFGGQVSLCQLTFAGVGAFAMGTIGVHNAWLGLLAAVGFSGVVGVIIALPALRLRGLYLALATLAFANAMDAAFFSTTTFAGQSGARFVPRLSLPGISLVSDRAEDMFLTVVFCVLSIGVLLMRRSQFGRRLVAMADSPSGAMTLGMSLTGTKVIVFGISSALAGLGGALYGGQQHTVTGTDFQLLASLTVLLLAVIWGIKTTSGMLLAGVTFALFPLLESDYSAFKYLVYLGTGLAAIGIGRNPNGVMGGNTPLEGIRRRRAKRATTLPIGVADGPTAEVSRSA